MKYTNIKIKLRAFLAVLVMLAFAVSATAQKISLTGVVRDAVSGETILGANILEKEPPTVRLPILMVNLVLLSLQMLSWWLNMLVTNHRKFR